MTAAPLSPAEKLKRRQRAGALARALARDLRQRLVDVPLEFDVQTDAPVGDEDASLYVKTDGIAVLRVLGVANDLARAIVAAEGIRIVPRVWPRTIWCRNSVRVVPDHLRAAVGEAGEPVLSARRDARGNTLLCVTASHVGAHDFTESTNEHPDVEESASYGI